MNLHKHLVGAVFADDWKPVIFQNIFPCFTGVPSCLITDHYAII